MAYSPRKEVPLLVETTHILPHVIDEVEAPQCCKSTQYEEGHEEIYGNSFMTLHLIFSYYEIIDVTPKLKVYLKL